jgi:hypothetical protein
MGNTFCQQVNESEEEKTVAATTKEYLDQLCKGSDGVTGGSVIGGYDSLQDYGNSVFSQAKEKLIRGIARDMAGVLKISPSFADKSDLKDVIEKFQKVVPNPQKGRKIKVDKVIHADVCRKFAIVINKNYGMDLINVDSSPAEVCNAITELLYSLFTGLHSEFLTVSGDVSRILKNLGVLQAHIDQVQKKLLSDIDAGDGSSDSSIIKSTIEALTREINRQHATLGNLVNSVVSPVGSSLIQLVEENKDFNGLTSDLESVAGTRDFTDKLSYMMSGVSSVAHAAYLVDKALKKLGMSVGEYKNTKDMKDLRTKIYDHLTKKKPNSREMNELLKAADILYRNDLAHDDIAAHLSSKKGGDAHDFGSMVSDRLFPVENDSVFKGRKFANRKSIGQQLNTKEKLKNRLFADLNLRIQEQYTKAIMGMQKIGKKIGSEIKITDDLRQFVRHLIFFGEVSPDRINLHKALSGYRTDANSRYIKHEFMESIKTLRDSAGALATGSGGIYFKEIQTCFNDLVKHVDTFNDVFTQSLTDVHVSLRPVDKLGQDVEGGEPSGEDEQTDAVHEDLSAVIGGMDDKHFKYLATMKKAIREIQYYFKIAGIKSNLAISASEQKHHSKDYEQILGEEAAMTIDLINKKYKELMDDLSKSDPIKSTNTSLFNQPIGGLLNSSTKDHVLLGTTADEQIKNAKLLKDGHKFLLEYMRTSKIEMIEAAQALDIYLSKFSEHLQSHPDDIKEFSKLLEQIEIVAKWFTDKSGDCAAIVFESFDSASTDNSGCINLSKAPANYMDMNNKNVLKPLTEENPKIKEPHYYDELESKSNLKAGRFYLPKLMTLEDAKQFVIRIEKTFKSNRALENVISTFSKVNNKMSGDSIRTFMSPGLIFKALMKYSVASSISVGYNYTTDYNNESLAGDQMIPRLNLNVSDAKAADPDDDPDDDPADAADPDAADYKIGGVLGGDSTQNSSILFSRIAVSMQTADVLRIDSDSYLDLRDPLALPKDYLSTDDIFEMCIKSMVAKVFTVVGVYSLFNRPAKDFKSSAAMATNPLRQIMGGANIPTIIPDALELYIRLPLLAEWYRKVFDFKQDTDSKDEVLVSIIPHIDGVWSKFVKIIFVKADKVEDGQYTASYSGELIESLNTIYKHYKSKYTTQEICTKIMENFVAEINTRYGMIKRSSINEYIKQRYNGLNDNEYDDTGDNVDFDILDSKDSFGRSTAPSDRFRKEGHSSKTNSDVFLKNFNKEIIKFRRTVETNLMVDDVQSNLGIECADLHDLVRETKKRITNSKNDSDRYEIVRSTISGAEKHANLDYDQMLLFHESVINPLTILYTVYCNINRFNAFANSMDVGEDHVELTKAVMKAFENDVANMNSAYKIIVKHFVECRNSKIKASNSSYTDEDENDFYYDASDASEYRLFFSTINDTPLTKLGVLGMDTPITWETQFGIRGDSNKFTEVLTRFVMDKNNAMEYILNTLFTLTCDKEKLVEVQYNGDGDKRYPGLVFHRLEELCIGLLEDVKGSLSKFRKVMPHSVISKYESNRLEKTTQPNVVSVFFLEEHLIDRLFKNKYGAGLPEANIALKNIWLYLTKSWDFDQIKNNAPINGKGYECCDSYNSVISRMSFWDNNSIDNIISLDKPQTLSDMTQFPASRIAPSLIGYGDGPDPAKIKEGMGINADIAQEGLKLLSKVAQLDQTNGPKTEQMSDNILFGFTNASDTSSTEDHPMRGAFQVRTRELGAVDASKYGLLCKLNRLIVHYVSLFTDSTSGKIYTPLLLRFANGVNAKEIMQGKSINNITTIKNPTKLSTRVGLMSLCEPSEQSILFTSLSIALKNVVTARRKNSPVPSLIFGEDNFLQVSEYMKDLMTAYLPVFRRELDIICQKADLLKSIMERTKIKVYKQKDMAAKKLHHSILSNDKKTRTNNVYQDMTDTNHLYNIYTASVDELKLDTLEKNQDYHPGTMKDCTALLKSRASTEFMDEPERKGYLLNMLNGITATAKSLTSCVTEVYKELSDIPMYFETYKNSITDYKNRTGVMPLMPLSQVSHLLNPNIYLTQPNPANTLKFNKITALRPIRYAGVGSSSFKFTYGTRGLLASDNKPSIELAPGVLSILDTYNAKFGGALSYDKNRVISTFEKSACLLRYATDIIYHKSYLGDNCLSVHCNDFIVKREGAAIGGAVDDINIVHNMACQTGAHKFNPDIPVTNDNKASFDKFFINSDNVTLLTDNDNYKQSVMRLLSCIVTDNSAMKLHDFSRKNMRIYNIIDCNIVPINFHALQREIPMVNLFNYSYTFDQMVKDFIGIEFKTKSVGDIVAKVEEYHFLDTHYPEDTLVRMLMHPRGTRMMREYTSMTMRIMTGATSLSLNRPKYLSDQLWNKVLLNSSFDTTGNYRLDGNGTPDLNENRYNAFLNRNTNSVINLATNADNGRQEDEKDEPYKVGITAPRFNNGLYKYIGPDRNRALSYMTTDTNNPRGLIKNVGIAESEVSVLNFQGYVRYQTKMVRYLEWFSQLQRVMRLLMRSELEWINDPIVHGHNAINEHVTEYEKNKQYSIGDFE